MKKQITGVLTAIMCAVSAAGITQSPIASAESSDDWFDSDDGWYEYGDDPEYTYDGDYLYRKFIDDYSANENLIRFYQSGDFNNDGETEAYLVYPGSENFTYDVYYLTPYSSRTVSQIPGMRSDIYLSVFECDGQYFLADIDSLSKPMYTIADITLMLVERDGNLTTAKIGGKEDTTVFYNAGFDKTISDLSGYLVVQNDSIVINYCLYDDPMGVHDPDSEYYVNSLKYKFDPYTNSFKVSGGDANGDGKLNVRDAAFIASMIARGRGNELSQSADFNGDGVVNVRDAAAIAKYLAGGK